MNSPSPDLRTSRQRYLDEQAASEPPLLPPDLPPDAIASPVEAHLTSRGRPVAVAGVVENGLIRPLDPSVKLPERSRVIIVSSGG
jgi:hypothetical protein